MKTNRNFFAFIASLLLLSRLLAPAQLANDKSTARDYSTEDLKTMLEALAQVEPVPFAKVLPQKFSTFGYWSFQDPAGPPLPGIHCN